VGSLSNGVVIIWLAVFRKTVDDSIDSGMGNIVIFGNIFFTNFFFCMKDIRYLGIVGYTQQFLLIGIF